MKCLASDGIKKIKEIFAKNDEKIEITYLAAGNFQVNVKDEDYKKANQKMNEFLVIVEKKGKQNSCEYSIEDK
jgi:translation initiation factor 2 alpha subunit (eIF-2alpha)